MKSRILSLLVAMALVLSLAVPAFAQTGETSEDNNLPDVTDVTEQEETEEDLPEETEEDEDNPGEPSVSEETIDASQNNTDNIVSGSAEDNEENEQEEAGTTDPEQENDSSDGNEDDSEEESDSEVEEDVDEDDTEPDGNEDFEEDENKPEDDADHSVDGLNSEEEEDESGKEKEDEPEDGENGSETDEGAENDETEEDNASADGENNSEEDVENNSEEDDESAEIDAEDENESEEIESEESEDEEPEENADAPVEFKLLTAEELEGIDLEDAEVLEVNSVVFMAAGATKSEPLMAAPKSAPSHSGTCGENLTWTLNDEGVLTISGTGAMDDYLLQYGVGSSPWSTAGQITRLILNDGITSIGGGAFYNLYEAVSEVTIPRSVISIGKSAFSGANGITTIRFEHTANDPLTIGQYAFYYYYGHTYDMTEHPTLSTTVIVPDKNNINPAISGHSWAEDVRSVTFKSASDSDSQGSSSANNMQPVYYNNSTTLEMIENWENRNTFYDIVLETILKNERKSEKYNVHNVAAAVYKAADIIGTTGELLINKFTPAEREAQDELMLKLLKENFSMYLAEERLIEQQQREVVLREAINKLTLGSMLQMGLSQYNIQIARKTSGMLQLVIGGLQIICDSEEDAYNICVMQANYGRAMEYLDNLQSNIDHNTSLYRACEMLREDIDSNWPIGGWTNRQNKKNLIESGKMIVSIISTSAIRSGYQWAYATKTAADISNSVINLRSITGDFCGTLMGWQMGALIGKVITKSTGDVLQDEEDMLRLYIASSEIRQAMENADNKEAIYDLSSLYLTAREAGLETSCKYFVDSGYALEDTNAIVDGVHRLRTTSPTMFALDAFLTSVKNMVSGPEPMYDYPETQAFYDMLYNEGCKLDEIRDAMDLPTYERNRKIADETGRILEKVYGAIIIKNTFESASHYDHLYERSVNFVDGLPIRDGKVNGKIPLEEYAELRKTSVQNPDADSMTLGKYLDGTIESGSYVAKAQYAGSTYFDMDEWAAIQTKYGLTDEEMFKTFNAPALDDSVLAGKQIRFSHDPNANEYKGTALYNEWNYLKENWGYTSLVEGEEYWYAQ